jgi:hypothetical protein
MPDNGICERFHRFALAAEVATVFLVGSGHLDNCRIQGFSFSQGIRISAPARDRRQRLEELQTSDGRAFPRRRKALVNREFDRLEHSLAYFVLRTSDLTAPIISSA